MTRKEWVKKNYPERIGEKFRDGVEGCPYSYATMPGCARALIECNKTTCRECWNKEVK